MKRLLPFFLLAPAGLLLTLPCFGPASAEEERTGVECGLHALVDLEDAGAGAMYDGLRKGLELAQMPRVCRADLESSAAALDVFLKALPVEQARPVFAIGDRVSARLAAARTSAARVLAVERYTIRGIPIRPLPKAEGVSVVYAAVSVRRVGRIIRSLGGDSPTHVALAWIDERRAPETSKVLARFFEAAGLQQAQASSSSGAKSKAVALLHLRLGVGERRLGFAAALKRARALKLPLISDDRARFGQGAVVTLVARHNLVGRATAETALRMRHDPTAKLVPRAVPGIEIWVDLAAADAQGLKVPLPFMARADKLKRGARRAQPAKKARVR